MKKPALGIQLFTLRDYIQTAEDFDKTLERLEKMGVKDVQISAIGDIPAPVQRDILVKHGMTVCVTHKSLERMENDLDALIDEHKIIGCNAIGLGAAPAEARWNSTCVRDFIRKTDEIGRKMHERGCEFHYHNHAFEFHQLDDTKRCMMDYILEETNPDYFKFIPDLGWLHFAGQDPAEFLKKTAGRVKVIHFKDYIIDADGYRHFVPLGEGVVDFESCYRTACELEIPYIVYEHDNEWPDNDPFKACEISWEYMKSLAEKY